MKLKTILIVIVSIIIQGCSSDSTSPRNDFLGELINEVHTDTLKMNMDKLSGELKVYLQNFEGFIESRNSYAEGNEIAADYLEKKFKQFGYEVTNHEFRTDGRNVIAELKGSSFPDQYYIICAHYDSMPFKGSAPGADDNASGTVAVLEAARILAQQTPQYSILFALWDEEEQGLYGSRAYADDANEKDKNILGVINLDMIGYDSDNNGEIDFVVESSADKTEMVNAGIEIISEYNLDIDYGFLYGKKYSDHAPFWSNGYPAITIIEDNSDFNRYYHSSNDTTDKINFAFLVKNTKLALGILAKLSFKL